MGHSLACTYLADLQPPHHSICHSIGLLLRWRRHCKNDLDATSRECEESGPNGGLVVEGGTGQKIAGSS